LPGAPYLLHVNFRLAGTALSGTEYILPAHHLPTEVIEDKKKEITLRVHLGQMIRNENYFPLKKDSEHLYFFDRPKVNPDGNIYLKEMILFARDHQNDFFETFPLKRIDFLGFKTPEINPMDKSSLNSSESLIEPDDKDLKNLSRDFLTRKIINPLVLFVDRMTEFKPSWKPSWKSPEKHMEFFNEIAPEMDNFYYLDEPSTDTRMAAGTPYYGPLSYNINNIPQFYFPDEYQLFLVVDIDGNSKSIPVGKKSELKAGMQNSAGPAYPSIDATFHLRNLFYKSLDMVEGGNLDFAHSGMRLEQILENPDGKKILNILGIDFLVFPKYHLTHLLPKSVYFPNPKTTFSGKVKGLLSMGLIPFDLPKSYKIAPRFPDRYGILVFKNPESYGKAFMAKWVKTTKPNDNYFNKNIFELGMVWPGSQTNVD
jgi:hypothetical protein